MSVGAFLSEEERKHSLSWRFPASPVVDADFTPKCRQRLPVGGVGGGVVIKRVFSTGWEGVALEVEE